MARLSLIFSGNNTALALIAAASMVAFAGGWLTDAAQPVTLAQASRNDWRDLAAWNDTAARDLGVLASRRPWGATPPDPAAAAAAAAAAGGAGAGQGGLSGISGAGPWRVSGVARQGGRFMAVMTETPAGKPAKSGYLQVGDKLPDGRSITAIDADAIEVEGAGGRQRIRLYWPKM